MRAALAVACFRRNVYAPFVAFLHPCDGYLPTYDEILEAESVGVNLCGVVVEHFSADERTFVVYGNDAVWLRLLAFASSEYLIENAFWKGLNALFLSKIFEECLVLKSVFVFAILCHFRGQNYE